jgi:hypothetical protein
VLRQRTFLPGNGRIPVPMNHCDLQTIVGPMNVGPFQTIFALPIPRQGLATGLLPNEQRACRHERGSPETGQRS